ncbi:hypothetical protein ABT061_23440 [Streptosporangium sp. NPDC002544]|uniref:hypothetical protein n=1 Tax=Streptosporangium sp. NPDC002544 TaxID=3154538 RepID=UPI0033213091
MGLWYPWSTALLTLGVCGLALVRRPWRGGLFMVPLAVVGGVAGLPWWCAPLLALVTAVMCLAFSPRVWVGSEHAIVVLLVLLLVASWVSPGGQDSPSHQALHDMVQVTAGLMILAVCAAAPPSAERLPMVVVLSGGRLPRWRPCSSGTLRPGPAGSTAWRDRRSADGGVPVPGPGTQACPPGAGIRTNTLDEAA